jgi:uncharacterized protein YdhG (YjbR/CyaY superfamily)
MNAEKPRFTTIDEYIASFPDDEVRSRLQTVRQTIKDEAPEAAEAISYQIPAFRLHGKPLIHFSAAKTTSRSIPGRRRWWRRFRKCPNTRRGKGPYSSPRASRCP